MKVLNLGILAHVDAGKTSLTERLLFAAGVIDQIGSVDDGSTQTGTLALERRRGITIKKAIEQAVRRTLREGLHGWPVTDCTVTLTQSGYTPPPLSGWSRWSTSAADYRNLTPLVLMAAVRQAGTRVYEPIHRLCLDLPAGTLALVLPLLARLDAAPGTPRPRGSSCLIQGDILAARVHRLRLRLAALTRGEGTLESAFDHYQPVHGQIPVRPRSGHSPLNRKEYLLHVKRRMAGERG